MLQVASRNVVLVLLVAVSVALFSRFRTVVGIRTRQGRCGLGGPAGVAILAVAALCISVSYGLVAAELDAWVTAPVVVAVATVSALTRMLISAARDEVRRGL